MGNLQCSQFFCKGRVSCLFREGREKMDHSLKFPGTTIILYLPEFMGKQVRKELGPPSLLIFPDPGLLQFLTQTGQGEPSVIGFMGIFQRLVVFLHLEVQQSQVVLQVGIIRLNFFG